MKIGRGIAKVLGIVLGNMIFAFGLAAFLVPNNFLVGGATGIARSVEYFFHVNVSVAVACINVIMFFLGLWILGKRFAMTTIISTLLFPVLLDGMLGIEALGHITSDRLLAAIFGGALVGLGLGIVMRLGGSTGGMDIPPLILNKKFRIPVAVTMYCFDVFILMSQVLFTGGEEILYGILSVLLTSFMVNQVLVFGAGDVQVLIISKEYEKINEIIQKDMDRGSTYVPIQTGFQHLDQKAVLCVLHNREMSHLNQYVQQIDPKAFIIINGVREVRGRGFTLDKHLK
ncbi:MAG: YitT family protein [Lachnospiraceae bacterium]